MADPVISVKLIVLYRFLSHNFPRSKTMWFLANSSIWHTKMLLNLTIPHPTTSLNVFLWQFPSFSSCLEQRTVRNTRGPFLVLFSFMKEQVFVPKTPNIFAIMTGPPSTIVHVMISRIQKLQIFLVNDNRFMYIHISISFCKNPTIISEHW